MVAGIPGVSRTRQDSISGSFSRIRNGGKWNEYFLKRETTEIMSTLKGRDVLSIADLSAEEIRQVLTLAARLKRGEIAPECRKVLGLLFYKASTRTRVSFTVAMYQLGGQVIDLNPSVTQVGRGEPLSDTARVLDRYLDILAIRTFKQQDLESFANYADIPIINALSDLEHPCQILADLQTIEETFGRLSGITLTYVGDGNNVANSLLLGGALMGLNVRVASPSGYRPDAGIVEKATAIAATTGSKLMITDDPIEGVKGSQVVYTDVWASMGQEDLANARIPIFQPYQVNDELMGHADSEAIILHCLPAHRGEEITDRAIEGKQSRVWDQAENRMHAQKALMVSLLGLL
jgi:ornithine carbamoyltransferase